MKLEITIADKNGVVLEQVLADTADLPNPDDENESARFILNHIERIVDVEVA